MKQISKLFSLLAISAMVAFTMQNCASKNANKKTAEAKTECCSSKTAEATKTGCSSECQSSCSTSCCSAQSTEKTSCCTHKETEGKVVAYYFHATRRCATCEAVEKVTKNALAEYYGDKVPFESINREKENDLVGKYKISGQSLIIVKGDKVINLTNDAFLNARNNPDKLKSKIKTTIDKLI
ncbi:MAG: thioredoxin family protein [Marinifilum sp.]|jgi:hypothetical protein|nr:thioredoxin family protein [Marinifilum sp.]